MPFLLLMSLALVLMWTVRLARAKGRNPWIWGGVALAPLVLSGLGLPEPWLLLSMLPMSGLLFLKAPRAQSSPGPKGVTCSRCQAGQPHGRYYCTNCGWELAKAHPEDMVAAGERATATSSNSLETVVHTPQTPPGEQLAEDPVQVEPAMAEEQSTPEDPPSEAPPPDEPQPQESPAAEEIVEPPRVFHGLPTAGALTERGIALFNQRRVQEAIDQFTKALALDTGYTPAWEARAEAYAQLGRQDDAAEDRRRLKAINAS